MKNVYFVQANSIYGTDQKTVYFPYAVGCIRAYCEADPRIAAAYRFQKLIYWRKPVDELVRDLVQPFMVLFSCSVWNMEYNKTVAAAVKARFPDCLISFGGHSVSTDGAMLDQYPFVDFLLHRFGEEPTVGLLRALAEDGSISAVPNLSFRDPEGVAVTTAYVPQTGTDYPSPYLSGVFDDLMEDDVSFSALMETNRGCPNACSFCDWSSLRSRVRLFPMERVTAEIDWFVNHRIEFVYCVDANFCLFDRDSDIVDYIVACKKTYGYPKVFRVFFTKNKFDLVFDIGSKLVDNGLDKAMTVSFQSMNPEVLENIGRRNISVEDFRKLMLRYNERRISTYSELIIGLPGETRESFCAGLCAMLENGQHFGINAYPCELLPNSEMGQKWYIEKYQIKTTRIPFRVIHSTLDAREDDIQEYGDYVISNYSMNTADWVYCLIFSNYVLGLHNLGLLRGVAVWCRYELGVDYERFYKSLIDFSRAHPKTLLGALFSAMDRLCGGVLTGSNEFVAPFANTGGLLWSFDEILFFEAYLSLDLFYAEIRDWLRNTFGAHEAMDALLRYQRAIVKKVGQTDITVDTDYDFYRFFNNVFRNAPMPLEKTPIRLEIHDPTPVSSFLQFARETVWYGRNRRETDYSGGHYPVRYTAMKKTEDGAVC